MLALAAVPQARAALVRIVAAVRPAEAAPSLVTTPAVPTTSFVPLAEIEDRPVNLPVQPVAEWVDAPVEELAPTFAYPELRDASEAQRIIQLFYPAQLQRTGIGGDVRVMVWVDETGLPTDREILVTSGAPALDRAALRALGRLEFRPARRQGQPVGSWVKFTIQFQPAEAMLRAIREADDAVGNADDTATPDSSAGMLEPI